MSTSQPSPADARQQEAATTPLTPAQVAAEQAALHTARARSRRSFLGLGLAGLAGVLGWRYLLHSPDEEGLPRALRRVLEFNGRLTKDYYERTRLAPEFARSQARPLRLNGNVGLGNDFDPAAWRLAGSSPSAAYGSSPLRTIRGYVASIPLALQALQDLAEPRKQV